MKYIILLLLVSFAFAQEPVKDAGLAKAIEGAQLLHSAMRDPDSFKISRAWIMSVEKFGDVAVCYDYFSRNGFGGMNASHANYSPHSHKDIVKGKYILDTYDNAEYFMGFFERCGPKAIKHAFGAPAPKSGCQGCHFSALFLRHGLEPTLPADQTTLAAHGGHVCRKV